MPKPKPLPDAEHHVHVSLFEEWLEEAWIWFKANWRWPLLGLAIGSVIVLGYSWRTHATQAQLNEGWTQLYTVTSEPEPEKRLTGLRNLVSQVSDPTLLAFTHQLIGDLEYQRSFDLSGEARNKALQLAQSSYQAVVDNYGTQSYPVGNAHVGLGLIHENLRQWDQALNAYKAVLNDSNLTGTPMQRFAADRINRVAMFKIPLVLGPASSQPDSQPASQPATAP